MSDGIKKLELSIVIINFRTPGFIINCLSSLLPEFNDINARVVVVDNHSGDSSPDKIKVWLAEYDTNSKVTFVQSETNGGFSAGNNIGIKTQKAKYYLLLNSDTLVRPGSIQQMLDTINVHSKAGLMSPRLEWPNGDGQESCFRFHRPLSEFMIAAQTGFIDRILKRHIVAMSVQPRLASPDWTSFACVLIRNEVFQQVGFMDEGYFMYFEDAEFCHRAQRAGWDIIHNPDARVVHLRGGSSPVKQNTKEKKRLPRYYYESRARYFYQIYGSFGLVAANLMWWLGRVISKARQIVGRADKATVDRQWLDIWIHSIKPLSKYTHPGSKNNK